MNFLKEIGRRPIAVGLAIVLSFVSGWFARRSSLRDYLRSPISYMLGRNSCGITAGYAALRARRTNGEACSALKARSHLIEESSDGLEHWQTPLGDFWNPIGNGIFDVLTEQSVRAYGDGPYRVKSGDIVLDCGANIGDFVREALSAGARLVIAIEPGPRTVPCLERNLRREIAAGTVRVVPKAVWHEAGKMRLALYSDSANDRLTQAPGDPLLADRYVEVPLITIDALVSELGLPRVDFIKMDIEGAEPNALLGARRTIAAFRPRMSIACEHSPGEYAEVKKAISKAAPYRSTCGRCQVSGLDVYPEIVFFTPQ